MIGGVAIVVIDMKNLCCDQVTNLNALFGSIDFDGDINGIGIKVLNFNTDKKLSLHNMLDCSIISGIEFCGNNIIEVCDCSNTLNYCEYYNHIDFSKLFGIFDISGINSASFMFINATIDGDITIRDIDFRNLKKADNMFFSAAFRTMCIENTKFNKLENSHGMFANVCANCIEFNNVDFSGMWLDNFESSILCILNTMFNRCSLNKLVIYPNCKWPAHKKYSSHKIVLAMFQGCIVDKLVISKDDTLLQNVFSNIGGIKSISYIEDEER